MTFQSTSDLFANRERIISNEDIRHYMEGFFRKLLRVDALYCDVSNMGARVKVRVRSVLIAQQVLLLTRDVQEHVRKDLGCDIVSLRAIVE